MYDQELVRDVLQHILESTRVIAKRFAAISSPEDFLSSDEGLEKLDAICMQLIAIGESVKQLDKITGGTLLPRYPQVEWKEVMGMRDMLAHHYFQLDTEVVYSVCAYHIGVLEQTVEKMLADLAQESE
ncbi:MAG: DUF86 domain-containing protein [Anaerolineae bacterium]|nr:DUF86 domain-containing protein [Anaerolineae bacterium]MDW8068444.1 DUF86 domain-containing protein [Anaerolineae bacterium]